MYKESDMARINIEECWWSDPRRQKLVRLLKGDARLADGLMIQAWRLAQEFCQKDFLIPIEQFLCLEDSHYLFDCFLAEVRLKDTPEVQYIQADTKQALDLAWNRLDRSKPYLVYVKGSDNYLAWVGHQRLKGSIGGKKSALRPRDSKGRLLPKIQADTKQALDEPPSQSKPLQASDSGSGSGSVSDSGFKKKNNVGIRTDYPQDFETVWLKYGRIGDKKEAYDQFKALGLKPDGVGHLEKAISGYFRKVPEAKFRKHFGRFLKMDWREFLDKNVTDPSQYTHTHKQTQPEAFQDQTEQVDDEVIEEIMKKFPRIVRELPR